MWGALHGAIIIAGLWPAAGVAAPAAGLVGSVLEHVEAIAGPRVIVIGDSHLNGSFGVDIHRYIEEFAGAGAHVIGSCGRWSNAWIKGLRAHCGLREVDVAGQVRWGKGCRRNPCSSEDGPDCRKRACRTPTIASLLADESPDVTVVILGGNSMHRSTTRDHWANIRPYVEKVSQAIVDSGSECLWVTPPHGMLKSRAKMRYFSRFIADATRGRCEVFDSHPDNLPWLDFDKAAEEAGLRKSQHDSIHYDRLGRAGRWRTRLWAKQIAQAVDALMLGAHQPTLLESAVSALQAAWYDRTIAAREVDDSGVLAGVIERMPAL